MYGTKKITIAKNGVIALEGNKTYAPIGRFYVVDGILVGRLRKVENPFETSLDDSNSIEFKLQTTTEVRNLAKSQYLNN
jgi:hypothetical protein